MIDTRQLHYRLILMDELGNQYDLKDITQDIGWEENDGELASRISFQLMNYAESNTLCLNGRMVFLMAVLNNEEQEVFRGTIKTKQNHYSLSERQINCVAYDMLHQLDQSQDNKHLTSGRTTRSIIEEITADWGIPITEYKGPDIAHGKMDFKNKSPAKMILEILDDAKKKGAGEYFLRSSAGEIRILPKMSNEHIYVFQHNHVMRVSGKEDIARMITRVKVIGQSKNEGNPPVEAVVDGKTEFGILQKIYQRSSDETIEAAKQAAQEILSEDGIPKEELTFTLPDIPFIRKGDAIYCDKLECADGYYQVVSINHDCDEKTMNMKIKKAQIPLQAQTDDSMTGQAEAVTYSTGSEVTYLGGMHYVSSFAGAKGYAVKGSGKAKIAKIVSGNAHPYHLIHCDSSCNVYGWVDVGSFQ